MWLTAKCPLLQTRLTPGHGSDTVDLPIGLLGEAHAELKACREKHFRARTARLAHPCSHEVRFGAGEDPCARRRVRLVQPVPGGCLA